MAHAIGMTMAGTASKGKRAICSSPFLQRRKVLCFRRVFPRLSASQVGSLSLLLCSHSPRLQAILIE
jgi:hypothetical protein